MPRRKRIFGNGEYYHIFNRSLGRVPIFKKKRISNQFLKSLEYYLQINPAIRYSVFKKLKRIEITPPYLVSVNTFSLMPNHLHFLLKQKYNDGLTTFMRRLTNSFSHYFNIKNSRRGPLFENRFKAVHIETEEQLLHVNRYIHLNSTSAYLAEDPYDYYYCSYRDYVVKSRFSWLDTSTIMGFFRSKNEYKKFVLDNKDYQRSLNTIKHLMLE